MAATKSDPARKLVRLDLPPADHHRLRVAAATAGVPMSDFARAAVLDAVAAAEKKSPKKS